MRFGYWLVEDKATGGFLGEAGFADFRREVQPSIEGYPEIGWALIPSAHGKGLATEAVRAVCTWGDRQFGSKPTVCMIDPENIASAWVAKKCGYNELTRAMYRDHRHQRRGPRLPGCANRPAALGSAGGRHDGGLQHHQPAARRQGQDHRRPRRR
jgi:RimJ/RimL family protein N-acetyltransferase